ncbi:MAG: PilT protein N-terminal [Actinoallomurus sp.]|nr:PilT protein N-terminal [Actinoallomurus sp.]
MVHEITADRLEQAADLAARAMLRMYDALFVQPAIERKLPLLTADAKLCSAMNGTAETDGGIAARSPPGGRLM